MLNIWPHKANMQSGCPPQRVYSLTQVIPFTLQMPMLLFSHYFQFLWEAESGEGIEVIPPPTAEQQADVWTVPTSTNFILTDCHHLTSYGAALSTNLAFWHKLFGRREKEQ